jgi:cardiolipin synthase
MKNSEVNYQKKIITIPNILSVVRLCLIPIIVWLYLGQKDYIMTGIFVLFSGLTDIVDGFIARRFNMITDFGKFLDPVADKATQLAVFICLITRFKLMIIPFVVLAVKEISSLAIRFVVYKRTETVDGAKWHGKTATGIVIATIILHLLWGDIPSSVSFGVICFCTAFMAFSFVLYTADCIKCLKNHGK